ncbi:MAG: cytochrome c-type biogenesis protein [Phenylobacterium sp.]|uniref:cytochrome c-type biogenesis protein n=1 Tax=Phenylobacterium sp. TaxID=1871053 RepID=UPI003016DFED
MPLAVALAAALCLAAASDPAERLPDPTQEARARALFQEVRCMVCQNESIADSEAGLAIDLRRLVRERIASGQDDAQVRSWLVDRYGEFVLLQPSFSWANLALWLAPLAAVIAGVLALAAHLRRPVLPDAALTEAEARRLSDLLAGTDGHDPALKSSRDDPNA